MHHQLTESTEAQTIAEHPKDMTNSNSAIKNNSGNTSSTTMNTNNKFQTPTSVCNIGNVNTDDTNNRRLLTTPSLTGQASIFNTNNLSPFTIKPFNEFEIGSGQRKLFEDEQMDYANSRPYRFDTPI